MTTHSSARIAMMHPDKDDNWPAFPALKCDHCDRPIEVSRFDDFLLRYWVVGATPATLQRLTDEHRCPA